MEKVILNEAQMSLYLQNEINNNHTENLVLLASISGNAALFEMALQLLKAYHKVGYIYPYMDVQRDYLTKNLKIVNYGQKF